MKKNTMMRMASVLLIAVLMSTCAISGTFAKYVTSDSGSDTARVAKFGVEITANGTTFAGEYDTHDTDAKATIAKSVVTSGDNMDLVAPGTSGNMASMTLSGTPEVAVKVTYVADFALSDNWIVDGEFYCPLVIRVESSEVNGLNYIDNKAGFEAAVETLINGWTKSYPAGTDLSTVAADSVSVYWEWPFSTSEANDNMDTKLGNIANAGDVISVSLTITTTVTQID